MEIIKIIDELISERKIFFSESDFQFALAWEIKRFYDDAKIRLEYCPNPKGKEYIDIIVNLENKIYPIELKYKTKSFTTEDNNEIYHLKNQAATDHGRYDYLKDIWRIEKFLKENENFECGYAILLTNDNLYWSKNKPKTIDEQFYLNENEIITGELGWSEKTSEGTKKGREKKIVLDGEYKINWNEFSNFGKKNGEFRYCLNEIKKR